MRLLAVLHLAGVVRACEVHAGNLTFDAHPRFSLLSFFNSTTSTTFFLSLCAPLTASDIFNATGVCDEMGSPALAVASSSGACVPLATTRGAADATPHGWRFTASGGGPCSSSDVWTVLVDVYCDARDHWQEVVSVSECGPCCIFFRVASRAGCATGCARAIGNDVGRAAICGGAERGSCAVAADLQAATCHCRAGFFGETCGSAASTHLHPLAGSSHENVAATSFAWEGRVILLIVTACAAVFFCSCMQRHFYLERESNPKMRCGALRMSNSFRRIVLLMIGALIVTASFFRQQHERTFSGLAVLATESNATSANLLLPSMLRNFDLSPGEFSSFMCTAGSQTFPKTLQATQRPAFPEADDLILRACRFRNVCLVKGELTYYADPLEAMAPPYLRAGALGRMFYEGYYEKSYNISTTIKVSASMLPAAMSFAPQDRTYLLGALSYPFNIGHVLVDTVMPAFAATDVFDLELAGVQLLNLRTCSTFATARDSSLNVARCRSNLDAWAGPFFHHPILAVPELPDACYGDLIMGHESAFALSGLYLHRAKVIRDMRRRLFEVHGLDSARPPRNALLSVLVLNKVKEIVPIEVPDLCAAVRRASALLEPSPRVECITPAYLSVAEQLVATSHAAVLVTEHGTTSYGALWLAPGAVALVVVPEVASRAKEPQVLLFSTDVQTFYVPDTAFTNSMLDGAGALSLALSRVGDRWSSSAPKPRLFIDVKS
jgi:hypothetical protein